LLLYDKTNLRGLKMKRIIMAIAMSAATLLYAEDSTHDDWTGVDSGVITIGTTTSTDGGDPLPPPPPIKG
jgi:hypothetical protein